MQNKEIIVICTVILLSGCGNRLDLEGYAKDFYPVTEQMEQMNWDSARVMHICEFQDDLEDSSRDDYLLAILESATIDYMNKENDTALNKYKNADSLITYIRGREFSEEISAFLTSDLALSYQGSDYEQVLVNYYMMKIYIEEGDIESALVECRAVNEKLELLNDNYAEDRRNRYSDDAFVQMITGLLYEANADKNNALVSYRNALDIYATQYADRYNLAPPSFLIRKVLEFTHDAGLYDLEDQYRHQWGDIVADYPQTESVLLVVETGFAPPRYELEVEIADGIELRMPYIKEEHVLQESPTFLTIENVTTGEIYAASIAQDIGQIAMENLEDFRTRYALRCLGSEVLRGLARDAVKEVSQGFGLFGMIAGAVVNATVFNKEETDLRAWLSLPDEIYIAEIPVSSIESNLIVHMDTLAVSLNPEDIRGSSEMGLLFTRI